MTTGTLTSPLDIGHWMTQLNGCVNKQEFQGIVLITRSECVEEKEIMQRTGHRSIETVRSYKRTSSEQLEQVSDIINCDVIFNQ